MPHSVREPKLRIKVQMPVVETETIASDGERRESPRVRVNGTREYTATITKSFEGFEEVAQALFDLFREPGNDQAYRYMHDHLKNLDGVDADDVHYRDATIEAWDTHGLPPAIFLAARMYAKHKTDTNLSSTEYSVERVLVSWIEGRGFGYPDDDGVVNLDDEKFARRARQALFWFCVDQTPGGEIDREAIPTDEEWGKLDFDKGELYGE